MVKQSAASETTIDTARMGGGTVLTASTAAKIDTADDTRTDNNVGLIVRLSHHDSQKHLSVHLKFIFVYWRWNLMSRKVFLFRFNFVCLGQL